MSGEPPTPSTLATATTCGATGSIDAPSANASGTFEGVDAQAINEVDARASKAAN